MPKTNPNDRCPCGSKKKYKRCCGSAKALNAASVKRQQVAAGSASSAPSVTIDLDGLGLPGTAVKIVTAPSNVSETDLGGRPGVYTVVFILARPTNLTPEDHTFSGELAYGLDGDSHLAMRRPAVADDVEMLRLEVRDEGGSYYDFRAYPNKRGFLSRIETSVRAQNAGQAVLFAYRALSPILNEYSVFLDVPLHIERFSAVENATGVATVQIPLPFFNQPTIPLPLADSLPEELQILGDLYRQALNSNSPFYQFLCFFRILERVRGTREARANECIARGEMPSNPSPRIPSERTAQEAWIKTLFPFDVQMHELAHISVFLPEVAGMKFNKIQDAHLRPIRHRIAHGLLDGGDPIVLASDGNDHDAVTRWLPLMRCMVRQCFLDEFPGVFDRTREIRHSPMPEGL